MANNKQHELKCHECNPEETRSSERDCRRCFFSQVPAVHDKFYTEAVLPYIWFSAVLLFLSYVVGLLFTLRTHAAVIWTTELDEKKHGTETLNTSQVTTVPLDAFPTRDMLGLTRQPTAGSLDRLQRQDIRESQLYQRILGQSLKQVGVLPANGTDRSQAVDGRPSSSIKSPYIVPPKSRDGDIPAGFNLQGLTDEDNHSLIRQVAEMAATAAAVAARDATRAPRKAAQLSSMPAHPTPGQGPTGEETAEGGALEQSGQAPGGGHDAPNWGRKKSAVILLTATIAYAIIAEILVNTVDSVLDNIDIDEKFLGITLFALVPNTTEFLNAISFAMNGNIALSMEIGSAYALQVCLLQIPALVLFSAVHGRYINPEDIIDHTFTLIFPQWDMITVILCVFLLR
jgi:Ca2+:H+ antiporter